ncbi:hypothetical protein ACHAQA_003892 [Verticillium albo-atrum]
MPPSAHSGPSPENPNLTLNITRRIADTVAEATRSDSDTIPLTPTTGTGPGVGTGIAFSLGLPAGVGARSESPHRLASRSLRRATRPSAAGTHGTAAAVAAAAATTHAAAVRQSPMPDVLESSGPGPEDILSDPGSGGFPMPLTHRPNRWPVEDLLEPEYRRHPAISPEKALELVDFSALVYPDAVDDNLTCPICKAPFVTPVTTTCDHTFCNNCLKQSCENSHTCPVDRRTFRVKNVAPASRLIRNLLDNLVVECPNVERGCTERTKREDIVVHVHDKCEYTLMYCPDADCGKKVVRWLLYQNEMKCLHQEVACEHCEEMVERAVLHDHLSKTCTQNTKACIFCDQTVPMPAMNRHVLEECLEFAAPCRYTDFGCRQTAKRQQLLSHHESCPYQVCDVIGQTLKRQESEMKRLQRENDRRDKQIEELQRQFQEQQGGGALDIMRLSPYSRKIGTAEEAVMGVYEDVERRIETVKKDLTDLEGRQTVMVLNEVMPIKNEITEIRSNLGILKMHVAWLMNKSREEVERSRLASRTVGGASAAGSTNASGVGAGGTGRTIVRGRGGSDSEAEGPSTSRRLSDGSNGVPRL